MATLCDPPPQVIGLRGGNPLPASIEKRLREHATTIAAFVHDPSAACLEFYDNAHIVRRTTASRYGLPYIMGYGIKSGMEVKIDKAGRIVIPKPLREQLGFKPDTELEVLEQPDGVLLKRVEQRPSLVKVDGLWVHQGRAEPGTNWERILEAVREERIESVLKA